MGRLRLLHRVKSILRRLVGWEVMGDLDLIILRILWILRMGAGIGIDLLIHLRRISWIIWVILIMLRMGWTSSRRDILMTNIRTSTNSTNTTTTSTREPTQAPSTPEATAPTGPKWTNGSASTKWMTPPNSTKTNSATSTSSPSQTPTPTPSKSPCSNNNKRDHTDKIIGTWEWRIRVLSTSQSIASSRRFRTMIMRMSIRAIRRVTRRIVRFRIITLMMSWRGSSSRIRISSIRWIVMWGSTIISSILRSCKDKRLDMETRTNTWMTKKKWVEASPRAPPQATTMTTTFPPLPTPKVLEVVVWWWEPALTQRPPVFTTTTNKTTTSQGKNTKTTKWFDN